MPRGVYERTEKHRTAASLGLLAAYARGLKSKGGGKPHTPESRKKISESLTGVPKSKDHVSKVAASNTGKKRSVETRRKLSESHAGNVPTAAARAALSKALKLAYSEGRKVAFFSDETRAKVAASARKRVGPLHPRWIKDRSKLKPRSRDRSGAHLAWSNAVRRRDRTCQLSHLGPCRGQLESHHIIPYVECEDLRYAADNGVLLCVGHHPRKQQDIKRLAPVLQSIVESRKGSN